MVVVAGALTGGWLIVDVAVELVVVAAVGLVIEGGVWVPSPSTSTSYCFKTLILSS